MGATDEWRSGRKGCGADWRSSKHCISPDYGVAGTRPGGEQRGARRMTGSLALIRHHPRRPQRVPPFSYAQRWCSTLFVLGLTPMAAAQLASLPVWRVAGACGLCLGAEQRGADGSNTSPTRPACHCGSSRGPSGRCNCARLSGLVAHRRPWRLLEPCPTAAC